MITQEEKEKVFDALVKEFQGKERFVGYYRKAIPTRSGPVIGINTINDSMIMKIKEIPIYEWRLRANGSADFSYALLKLIEND